VSKSSVTQKTALRAAEGVWDPMVGSWTWLGLL
jgi:hypothetical protein